MADNLPDQLFPQQCGCADCEAAVSPAAYQAALLDYVLKHVRNNKLKFDLKFLDDTFHQPFSELPTDCEAVEKQVRQVRICIEVLRGYLGKRPLADPVKEEVLAKAEEDSRFAAYSLLLSRVGTSYEEIRRIHKELPENRKALAERLGIALTLPRPADLPGDELDQLLLVVKADQPPSPHFLTEQLLETLFGLADTTRDPLSEAAKLGDDHEQLIRWNLNGAVWGQNTNSEGMVYVTLANPAANVFRVELYQDSLRTKLVASGQIATASGTVKLVNENNSGLSGVIEIAYTVGSSTIAIAAIPTFLNWQLKHLRSLWTEQDYPMDGYSDEASPKLPIIDPDLIGPDDFRDPTPKIKAANPNKAFDLWLQRRNDIDKIFQGFKKNREKAKGGGLNTILKQVFGDPLPDLDGLLSTLTKGADPDMIKTAKESVVALNLTIESFIRLMTLRAKDQLASDPRNEKVSEAEWSEVYAILTQVMKVRQFDSWRKDEQDIELLLGTQEFWFALSEPKEGDWPPLSHPDIPFIDPSVTKLADLPDVTVGKTAITLWKTRSDLLAKIQKDLKTKREDKGFDAMLSWALGDPKPGDALQYDLEKLKTDLASPDQPTQDTATKQIENDLHLTIDSFKRLMVIKANKNPTANEWEEVYTILTSARKVKHEYHGWLKDEQKANLTKPNYWMALKAKLPRWRASLEARQAWQQALRVRSQRPIIDPTLMGADDLQRKVPGDPVFDIWKTRYDERTNRLNGLKDTLTHSIEVEANALKGLDTIIKETLDLEAADLEALDKDRQSGYSIEKRLAQFNFTNGAFTYLTRIRALAEAKETITDSEQDIVCATLAHSKFQREYAALRKEESGKHIILSQDFFKIPKALSTPLPSLDPSMPIWLSTWQDRRDWQDMLQTRIDQESSSIEALRNAISAVEEAVLPTLRDALIQSSDAMGDKLEEQAEWITNRLLIDAKAGGCQVTTRVEQAIETLQTLLFDLRTGQLKQLLSTQLSLIPDNFDEEWKWIGSYATWRSAMFVTLYPENILQPSLLKYKTPAFEKLIINTRGLRLKPKNACEQAEAYADYFRDICSLEIEATCQASTVMYSSDGCDRQLSNEQNMFYMFARATSGKIYWSAYDSGGSSSASRQTLWEKVPGFDDTKVDQIVGAMPYRIEAKNSIKDINQRIVQSSYIYLFCIAGEADKKALKLVRLSLDEFGKWGGDGTAIELSIPKINFSYLEIIPVQTQNEFIRPGLIFHKIQDSYVYYRTLNDGGVEWDQQNVDWPSFYFLYDEWGGIQSIKAALKVNSELLWIVNTSPFALRGLEFNFLALKPGNKPPWVSKGWTFGKAEFLGALPGPEDAEKFEIGQIGQIGQIKPKFSAIYIFWRDSLGLHYRRFTSVYGDEKNNLVHDTLTGLIQIPPNSGRGTSGQQMLAYKRGKNAQSFYMYKYTESGDKLIGSATIRAVPRVKAPLNIPLHLSATDLQKRRQDIINAFARNNDATASVRQYLHEMYYFVPLHLALALQASGNYLASLDCFRTFYDYEALIEPPNQPNKRNIYYGLELDAKLPDVSVYQQADNWLLDPLNPHLTAATRRYAYTRFTCMSLVRCLLDFADSEFAQDTGESLARARTLYLTALAQLNLPELQQKLGKCDDLIAQLKIEPGKDIPPEVPAAVGEIMEQLTKDTSIDRSAVVIKVNATLKEVASWAEKLDKARTVVQDAIKIAPLPRTTGASVVDKAANLKDKYTYLFTQPNMDLILSEVGKSAVEKHLGGVGQPQPPAQPDLSKPMQGLPPGATVITLSLQFCISPNPILKALRLRAELNLFKLRTCRNIAGMKRQLEPYAAPTDTTSGLPTIGAGGQLVLPGISIIRPTIYRYPVLIERAKQLAQLAGQIEAAMLSALVQRDAEAFNLLKSRQELKLAQAGVQLQSLRIVEANSSVKLAELQRDRAQIQLQQYQKWIADGYNSWEQAMILNYEDLQKAQKQAAELELMAQIYQTLTTAAAGGATGAAAAAVPAAVASLARTFQLNQTNKVIEAQNAVQVNSFYASYERRKKEWEFQELLASQDISIGNQQITVANNQVNVVTQEKVIAELQTSNAKDTIEFLTTKKFTNVNLFDWMSGVLEGGYRYFLQQATAMANLALNQLAFERQEVPPAFIKSDYWEVPSDDDALGSSDGKGPDRKGLTGSARLLQDIYQLDQYAFNTNKRKLQLTKTFSLAQMAPAEFQQFRQTGVMVFATPMELFDRGFPGHYLRLIKRVRTSVIALIPPVQGIHATLTSSGLTRTVIGPDIFQTVPIRRDPEFVALTSPVNSTGMFELEPQQTDMLLPFEGNGVDSAWEFRMPKAANQFDYRTLADVLITIEYTALNSFDYRQQVIQTLKPNLSADRSFSFRNLFADQWYDLNNPDQTKTPMKVRFQTIREDFPPNVETLKIQQVLLYFVLTNQKAFELPITELRFTEKGNQGTVGGSATPIDGIISTRRGNASSWTSMIGKSLVGEWELTLPNTEEVKKRFQDEELDDILFVITYAGRTPEWPS
jgi:hypothetical protein